MPKECVSTSTTSDLHTYLLRRSAIKFTSLLKNNNDTLKIMSVIRCELMNYISQRQQRVPSGVLELSSHHFRRKQRRGGIDTQREDMANRLPPSSPHEGHMGASHTSTTASRTHSWGGRCTSCCMTFQAL